MNFALIGYPLGHSASPFIHARLFSLGGVSADYRNIEIPPEEFDIDGLKQSVCGFNVTIPYKTRIIPYLAELRGSAQMLKTVNTVRIENGRLFGYNTDAEGMQKALALAGIELKGRVLICGAGGTARMIAAVAASRGCDVTLAVRESSMEKANSIQRDIAEDFGADAAVVLADSVSGEYDILLNATPAGMYPRLIGQTPVAKSVIERISAVFDAVYNPQETELLKIARSVGAKTAEGLHMLVYQAAAAQKIWLGAEFADSDLLGICRETAQFIHQNFH